MTLNGVIAHIFLFSPNSIALFANYVTVVEDRPILSVKYCLTVASFTFGQNERTLQRGLSAIAEHLVVTALIFYFECKIIK